jgi:glucokinase
MRATPRMTHDAIACAASISAEPALSEEPLTAQVRSYPGLMPQTRVAIGMDVGGTKTKGALVDSDGRVVLRVERATDPSAGTKGIIDVVDDLVRRAPEHGAEVTCVGVGAAGFINADTGSVNFAPNLTYDDPHVADAVRTRTGLPVILDNDANVAAWGERAFGTAKGMNDVALLTLGTGIGSGFVVNGQLLRGATGAGAEFGHTVVVPDGVECPCGLRGCIEQYASGGAIGRAGRRAADEDPQTTIIHFAGSVDEITAEHVAKAAREYDETARKLLHDAGHMLGIGMSNVANLFDPEVIVLGGSVVRAGEAYLGAARDTLVAMTNAQRRRPIRIDVTTLGSDAGIIGAAALGFDEAR